MVGIIEVCGENFSISKTYLPFSLRMSYNMLGIHTHTITNTVWLLKVTARIFINYYGPKLYNKFILYNFHYPFHIIVNLLFFFGVFKTCCGASFGQECKFCLNERFKPYWPSLLSLPGVWGGTSSLTPKQVIKNVPAFIFFWMICEDMHYVHIPVNVIS